MPPPPPRRPEVSLIAAVARNGVIGRGGALAWSDPEDLRRLRRVTMGAPVMMGRRTWDSLPARFRPLPGRRNIVVTRDPRWSAAGAEAVASVAEALERAGDAPKVFVAGGAEIYALALPFADELVLTQVDADLDGDARFPEWDRARFAPVASEAPHVDANGVAFSFVTYRRIAG